MRGIDDACENPLHEVMSRPFCLILPALLLAVSLCFTACVGTLYDRTYSNKKNYFKAPVAKREASAETILQAVDANTKPSGAPDANAPGGLQPGGDIPGLPAAGMPAVPGLDAPPAAPAPAVPPAAPPP